MSKKHQVCNQCVDMNHNLMVGVRFNPHGSYMMSQQNGVKFLVKEFSTLFCESTGGRFIKKYKPSKGYLVMEFEVYPDTFALFEADYDRFMTAVFGEIPLNAFGDGKLIVFNHHQILAETRKDFIATALGD